MDTYIMVFLIS